MWVLNVFDKNLAQLIPVGPMKDIYNYSKVYMDTMTDNMWVKRRTVLESFCEMLHGDITGSAAQ